MFADAISKWTGGDILLAQRNVVLALCVLSVAGCSNVPSPNYVGNDAEVQGPSLKDLVKHIECEIIQSRHFNVLAGQKYLAGVTLTLKVEDTAALTPSLSFINPMAMGAESIAYGVGATLSGDRQRSFITNFTIDLATLSTSSLAGAAGCTQNATGLDGMYSLRGDLGIGGIVQSGLDVTEYQQYNASNPSSTPSAGSDVFDLRQGSAVVPSYRVSPQLTKPKPSQPVPPSFGSTTQFIVVKSVNAGPTWSLVHFKGPSGSNGLFNIGRTDTDTLILAFAPAGSPALSAPKAPNPGLFKSQIELDAANKQYDADLTQYSIDQGASAARAQGQVQTLTTNILLQNLTSLQAAPH